MSGKVLFRTALYAFMVSVMACSGLAVEKSEFRLDLERRWLEELRPKTGRRHNRGHNGNITPEQDAYGAVNGKRYDANCGFHTVNGGGQWWQVDLGKEYAIGKVVVYNRTSYEKRARNLGILISPDAKKWISVHKNNADFFGGKRGTKPLEVSLDGKKGRYVRLQVVNTFLHLNEVEVYAQGDNKTNIALKKPATQSSTSQWSTKSIEKPPRLAAAPVGSKNVPQTAKAQNIKDILAMADKTLEYVQKSRKMPRYAALLKKFHARWNAGKVSPNEYDDFYLRVRYFRRLTILAHPNLNFSKILINRNPPSKYSHNGDQHLGRHSREGPGLTILSNWKKDPQVKTLLEGKLPRGAFRNPDLHYNADRVVFAYCDHTGTGQRRYFLYEAAIDGSWVKQLTGTKRDPFEGSGGRATALIEDNDPCYLPGGDLVFISSRAQSYGRCHGGRYNPAWVLYRCDRNGGNIRQISWNNENEYDPSVLNDGRIVFTRWEYTDRHEMFFHMLWTCRPDGTQISHFFGNDMASPHQMLEALAIPGSHKVVTTAQGHHSYTTGTIVVLDTNKGENGEHCIERVTPETPYSEDYGWPETHFSHAYPLNEHIFLVSRAGHRVHQQGRTPPPNGRAIYLVDTLGGREFLYEDLDVASVSPIPIRKRKTPPALPSMLPEKPKDYGTVFVQNACLTRKENDPDGVIKPGMIKALRVNALGVQPLSRRAPISRYAANNIPKKVLGTVPVDENGSAYFKVPANTALQVQTLDENGMAILTEKSFFYVMPGENRSCIGCHEKPGTTPDMKVMAKKGRLKPVDLTPPAGPQYPGGLSFMRTVQPVLDRYCIGCHGLGGGENRKADKVNLVHDGKTWPKSWDELAKRGDHRVGEKGYMQGNGAAFNFSVPRRFYAYKNKVAHMILKNHGKVNMDRDSYMRMIEFFDVNAQCYGDMFPNKLEERKVHSHNYREFKEYVKQEFGDKLASQPERALINLAQPDESRILMAPLSLKAGGWGQINKWKSTNDPGYKKMTALVDKCIIRKKNENTLGWNPTHEMGAAEGWVLEERAKLFELLGISKSKN